jgi:hypothetical protein
MKKNTIVALAITFFFIACNDKKSKETTTNTGSDTTEKVKTEENTGQDLTDDLSKLTPMTADQMKALLPATLVGIAKTGENATESRGTMFANANYKKNDSAYMMLSIYDCAGSAGAGVYNMHIQDLANPPEQTDQEYTKTIDVKGGKAIESCNSLYNNCSLTYFGGKRYLVVIQETSLGVAVLQQAAGELSLK